ncbi:hypothetical protein ACFSTD_08660 [Novosphingobium colocasiae]
MTAQRHRAHQVLDPCRQLPVNRRPDVGQDVLPHAVEQPLEHIDRRHHREQARKRGQRPARQDRIVDQHQVQRPADQEEVEHRTQQADHDQSRAEARDHRCQRRVAAAPRAVPAPIRLNKSAPQRTSPARLSRSAPAFGSQCSSLV